MINFSISLVMKLLRFYMGFPVFLLAVGIVASADFFLFRADELKIVQEGINCKFD